MMLWITDKLKKNQGNFHLIKQQKIQIQGKLDFIISTAQNYFLESVIQLFYLYTSKSRTGPFLQKD